MPEDWSGMVELIDEGGDVVAGEVQAVLRKQHSGGLWSWGGMLGPHTVASDWTNVTAVRLPSGTQGRVILNAQIHSDVYGANQRATVTGSGDPPF